MSFNMTAELLAKFWLRNGARWIHWASHTGQYNKSEHCTRRQSTNARYACLNSWWDMKSILIKNEKQQTRVEPAPRRVPGSLHTQLNCPQTHSLFKRIVPSCYGGKEIVSFTSGSGVWCRINCLRRNWVEMKLFTTDRSLMVLTALAS
jgi:hypothetical protein